MKTQLKALRGLLFAGGLVVGLTGQPIMAGRYYGVGLQFGLADA